MTIREKVIKALKQCRQTWECKRECPYYGDESSWCDMYTDAIKLLEWQGWHIFHLREVEEDEKEDYPNQSYIMSVDCVPNNGEEFLWYRKCSGDISIATWDDDCWAEYCDTGDGDPIEDGDAWMELPEPPKGDESE